MFNIYNSIKLLKKKETCINFKYDENIKYLIIKDASKNIARKGYMGKGVVNDI